MKEYTVRYNDGHGSLVAVSAYGKSVKFTESEALAEAGRIAMKYKSYAKVYRGRHLVHTITVHQKEV